MSASYLSTRRIPLALCYHAVSDRLDDDLAVTTEHLREQVEVLAQAGFRSVRFSELERMRIAGEDVSNVVALTFDDGYESTTKAGEILAEHDFIGTVFVLPPSLGSGVALSWPGIEHLSEGPQAGELVPMTWEAADALRERGWEIGSHTLTHPRLTEVSDELLEHEVRASRESLRERYGDCTAIAYPYGAADDRVARAAAAAGYECGTTLSRWHRHDTAHLRPRVGIYLSDDLRRFRIKIARWSRSLRAVPLGRSA